jgi:hypothetical protein
MDYDNIAEVTGKSYADFLARLPEAAIEMPAASRPLFVAKYDTANEAPLSSLKCSRVFRALTGGSRVLNFEEFLVFVARVLAVAWEVPCNTGPLEDDALEGLVMLAVETVLQGVPIPDVTRTATAGKHKKHSSRSRSRSRESSGREEEDDDDGEDNESVSSLTSSSPLWKLPWQKQATPLPIKLRALLKQGVELSKDSVRKDFIKSLTEYEGLGPSPPNLMPSVPSDDAFKRQIDNRIRECLRLQAEIIESCDDPKSTYDSYEAMHSLFGLIGAISHT